MAKLSSPRTELAVLRAACHRNELISGHVLHSIDDSYFYNQESKEVFEIIQSIRNETGKVPSYRMVLEHPNITSECVSFLRNSEVVIQDPREAARAISSLAEFRRRRGLAEIANTISEQLSKPKVDSRALLESTVSQISATQSSKEGATYTHFGGTKDNAASIVNQVLYEDRSKAIVPTGFKTFDRVNGGLFRGSLFGIAGTTGGGKSTLANQLAVNIASAGYSVDILPLEMSELEMTVRIMSTVTKFDSLKLLLQKMTPAEKRAVEEKFNKWRAYLKRRGGAYNIYKPKEDVTIQEALNAMSVHNSTVKIIDYMGLLSGMDGDDQWRRLGAAARYAKIYAEATNSIVVILAQLDDAGKVRYSRAIVEHCLVGDTWIDTPDGLIQLQHLQSADAGNHDSMSRLVVSENGVQKTTHFHRNGIKPVYQAHFSVGADITGTLTHKFMVLNRDLSITWKEMGELEPGDYVAQNQKTRWPSKLVGAPKPLPSLHFNTMHTKPLKKVTVDVAYLLGGLLSDGYVGDDKVEFVTADKDSANAMSETANRIFPGFFYMVETTTKSGTTVYRVASHRVCVIRAIQAFAGMNGGSGQKYIPDEIMRSPKDVVAACLKTMFDGDGSASKRSVSYSTTSYEMANRLVVVLAKFGIHARLSTVNHRYDRAQLYNVVITSGRLRRLFADSIGFVASRKLAMLYANMDGGEYDEKIPFVSQWLYDNNHTETLIRHSSWRGKSKNASRYPVSRKNISLVAKEINKPELAQLGQYRWVKFTGKHYVGRKPVFDLTVEDTHSYVANGHVVHNCSNFWGFVGTKESREAGLINIEQTKARNQKQFSFSLRVQGEFMRVSDLPNNGVDTGNDLPAPSKPLPNLADSI